MVVRRAVPRIIRGARPRWLIGSGDRGARSIRSVAADRNTMKTDEAVLIVGPTTYRWKVRDADNMVAILNSKLYA